MEILGAIIISIIFITICFLTGFWICHISMTIEDCELWGFGSKKTFINEFNKYNWYVEKLGNSYILYSKDGGNIFCLTIYKINNVGMVFLNPISYYSVVLFLKKTIKKRLIKSGQYQKRYNWKTQE